MASVDHVSLHAALSDYHSYAGLARNRKINLLMFSIGLVEDTLINLYAARTWPDVFNTQVYANAIAYLRLKDPSHLYSAPMRAQAAVLMMMIAGRVRGKIPKDLEKSAEQIIDHLKDFRSSLPENLGALKKGEFSSQIDQMKIQAVEDIYLEMERYGEPPEVASLPHQDHHGESRIYTDLYLRPSEAELDRLLKDIYGNAVTILSGDTQLPATAAHLDGDSSYSFSKWETQDRLQRKILSRYRDLVKGTRFRSFGFPQEDYGEYLRLRAILGGKIRQMAEQLLMIKNQQEELFREEMGVIDLQETIQVLASKSQRSDVFIRNDPIKKDEAWALLIDLSQSTRWMIGNTRRYATCLAETAAVALAETTALLASDNEPWGMYGFSDRFYIVKDFSEGFSNTVRARIGGLKPGGLTYLPDAIRLVTRSIKKASMSDRNFLVLISDGLPAGYKAIEEDTTSALSETEEGGIITLAIGLDTKSIKRFFSHFCVVSTPTDMMRKYIDAYMELSSAL